MKHTFSIKLKSRPNPSLHVEFLGGFLDRVGDQAAAEVGDAGWVAAAVPAAAAALRAAAALGAGPARGEAAGAGQVAGVPVDPAGRARGGPGPQEGAPLLVAGPAGQQLHVAVVAVAVVQGHHCSRGVHGLQIRQIREIRFTGRQIREIIMYYRTIRYIPRKA